MGSESDNTIQFAVPTNPNVFNNGATTTNDDDRNNSCTTCQPGHVVNTSTVPMGSTTYFNDGTNIPAFTLTDIQWCWRHGHQWRGQSGSEGLWSKFDILLREL